MHRLLALALVALAACTHHEAGERSPKNPVELGPWLLDPEATEMTVAWTTPRPSVGIVEYGQGGLLDHTAQGTETTTDHRVRLTALPPGEKVDFRIPGDPPAWGHFTTAPAPDADAFQRPYKVLIYGDNRTNGGDHALVVRAAESENAILALHTGDMVLDAKQSKAWAVWFDVERDLLAHTPIIPTVGNHEITDHGASYSRHFKSPGRPTFRAIHYGNLHVLVLDSFEQAAGAEPHRGAVSDAQRAWAEAEAKTIPKEHHLWVLVHQGPFAHPIVMRPGHGGSESVRALVHAVNAIHPVEATFAGHEHFYERGREEGLVYFVLGGGGAPLEDPDPSFPGVNKALKSLSFVTIDICGCHAVGRAKDITGRVLDEFVLGDCPQACRAPPSEFAIPALPAPDAGPELATADAGTPTLAAATATAIATPAIAVPPASAPAVAAPAAEPKADPKPSTRHKRRRSSKSR